MNVIFILQQLVKWRICSFVFRSHYVWLFLIEPKYYFWIFYVSLLLFKLIASPYICNFLSVYNDFLEYCWQNLLPSIGIGVVIDISFCGKISLMLNLKRYPQPLQSRVGRFRECRALAFLSSLFVSCIYSLVSSKDTVFSWTALLQSSGSLKSVASHDGFSALHLCMENFVVCNPVLPRVSQDLIVFQVCRCLTGVQESRYYNRLVACVTLGFS